jgi:hypothetical protein
MASAVRTVSIEEMEALAGHRFPGGTFTILPWENALLCDVMVCPVPPDGLAHPAFLFHAPLAGVGLTYGDIFELCHAESDEAVRAGEYDWDVKRPLRVGITYRMSGGIDGVVRKRGRRGGLMDIVTFHIDVADVADVPDVPDVADVAGDAGGDLVARVVNSWIFLRSEP